MTIPADALAAIQAAPFAMIPAADAQALLEAGLATVASVQLSDDDTAAAPGCIPMQCTLEGLSYGTVDTSAASGVASDDDESNGSALIPTSDDQSA